MRKFGGKFMVKKLFEFMNKNKINYVVLRGYDSKSKDSGKDLDILISKEDYEKFKEKFPKSKRVVDFYQDKEEKKGFVIVGRGALDRKVFDKKLGFFILSERDLKKMNSLRKIIHKVRVVKQKFGMYENKKMRASGVFYRNLKMFGFRYVFWDIFYQLFRGIYNKTHKKKLKQKQEKKHLIKKKIYDFEMYIDENGLGIHRDLFLKGTREEVSVGIIKNFLKSGDVVLEAGANIGYYTILESKLIGNKGIVYAVEPIKENFELLKKNIALNKLKNVKTFNLGFSNIKGRLNINVSPEGNLNTPAEIGKISRVDVVKCETLDGFFKGKRKPNFIRMDIEGYEDVIFSGGEKTLNNLRGIFVELHFPLIGEQRMINLLRKLKDKGFEIHRAIMEWERLEDESTWLGRFVNWFYKKRSKPVVYENMSIDDLIKSKNFLQGHLSLEVFFVKKNEKENN